MKGRTRSGHEGMWVIDWAKDRDHALVLVERHDLRLEG